jgi:hypothetical protein
MPISQKIIKTITTGIIQIMAKGFRVIPQKYKKNRLTYFGKKQ